MTITPLMLSTFTVAALSLAFANELPANAKELPFERLVATLTLDSPQNEFIVVRTSKDLRRMWQLHAGQLPASNPPAVDFHRTIIVAFFGGGIVCEPYKITRVTESSTKVTVEVTHSVMGDEACTCVAMFSPSAEVVSITRVDKPIEYFVRPKPIDCGH